MTFDIPTVSRYNSWEKEFVFLRKINGKWVFCKTVHVRSGIGYRYYIKDYALNDFELIQRTAYDHQR